MKEAFKLKFLALHSEGIKAGLLLSCNSDSIRYYLCTIIRYTFISLTANVSGWVADGGGDRERKTSKQAQGHSQDSRLMLTVHTVLDREQLDRYQCNVFPLS